MENPDVCYIQVVGPSRFLCVVAGCERHMMNDAALFCENHAGQLAPEGGWKIRNGFTLDFYRQMIKDQRDYERQHGWDAPRQEISVAPGPLNQTIFPSVWQGGQESFQNADKLTLVKESDLRRLEEAYRTNREIVEVAHKHGWNGVENSKILARFLEDALERLDRRADLLPVEHLTAELELAQDKNVEAQKTISDLTMRVYELEQLLHQHEQILPSFRRRLDMLLRSFEATVKGIH